MSPAGKGNIHTDRRTEGPCHSIDRKTAAGKAPEAEEAGFSTICDFNLFISLKNCIIISIYLRELQYCVLYSLRALQILFTVGVTAR